MTFSEYYNALYPYLSDGDTDREAFYDEMLRHFIFEEAQESCALLLCKSDTKKRYIKEINPNKIKPENAGFAYSKHNPQRYIKWLYNRMFDQDSFHKIEEWLKANDIEFRDACEACDTLLEDILFGIAYPYASDGGEVKFPVADNVSGQKSSGLERLTDNDRALLKDFWIDFDSILEKCIKSDQSEVWLTGRITGTINSLYNDKWKDRMADFEDIRLQSDILNTVATLREFCDALNPDKEKAPTSPIRKLKIELRDCYIKIHPDKYAGLFPYDAYIDDWNE